MFRRRKRDGGAAAEAPMNTTTKPATTKPTTTTPSTTTKSGAVPEKVFLRLFYNNAD